MIALMTVASKESVQVVISRVKSRSGWDRGHTRGSGGSSESNMDIEGDGDVQDEREDMHAQIPEARQAA